MEASMPSGYFMSFMLFMPFLFRLFGKHADSGVPSGGYSMFR